MWNERQKSCLKELGIPVWERRFKESVTEQASTDPENIVATALETESAADNTDTDINETTTQLKPAFYRLAQWYLQFPEPMPGTGYVWVRDLGKAYEDRATQVSNVPAGANVVDCADYATSELTPDQKRTLWRRLKESAVSSDS